MTTQVRLFVSAGPEEDPAREVLGRTLAELPVNVGWVIKRSPDVDSVAECHLFCVLLGRDIVAPVGLELYWARRTEKPVLAYAAQGSRTPAGQVFRQENIALDWSPYAGLVHLRRLFLRDVARFLLAHAERYGVTVAEGERLRGMIAALEKQLARQVKASPAEGADAGGDERGAGGGGVILAPGKDTPRGAHLLGEDR